MKQSRECSPVGDAHHTQRRLLTVYTRMQSWMYSYMSDCTIKVQVAGHRGSSSSSSDQPSLVPYCSHQAPAQAQPLP
jgi:hypothetical protein